MSQEHESSSDGRSRSTDGCRAVVQQVSCHEEERYCPHSMIKKSEVDESLSQLISTSEVGAIIGEGIKLHWNALEQSVVQASGRVESRPEDEG